MLNHWNAGIVTPPPIITSVDVTYLHIDFAARKRQKRLDKLFTEMTALPTVDPQRRHSAGRPGFVHPFVNCRHKTAQAAIAAQAPTADLQTCQQAGDCGNRSSNIT